MTQTIFQHRAVSYCLLDNVSVFLDRRNDKYHYVNQEKTEILNRLRNGFSNKESPESGLERFPETTAIELKAKNLLTTTAREGKALQPVEHPSPRASVYDVHWRRRVHPVMIASIALQYNTLHRRMLRESLYETTQKAEKVKANLKRQVPQKTDREISIAAKRIIDSRYFVYTYSDKCLFDSCLFFHYFIERGVPLNWVFGVNLFPFSAHSWVEYKGVVLNDHLERVAAFTPIYVI